MAKKKKPGKGPDVSFDYGFLQGTRKGKAKKPKKTGRRTQSFGS